MEGGPRSGESLGPGEGGVWRSWPLFSGEQMMAKARARAVAKVRGKCPQEEKEACGVHPRLSAQGSCSGTHQNSRPGGPVGMTRSVRRSLELRDTGQVTSVHNNWYPERGCPQGDVRTGERSSPGATLQVLGGDREGATRGQEGKPGEQRQGRTRGGQFQEDRGVTSTWVDTDKASEQPLDLLGLQWP